MKRAAEPESSGEAESKKKKVDKSVTIAGFFFAVVSLFLTCDYDKTSQ